MKRLLQKLPHRHKDHSPDESQPSSPKQTKTASRPTSTVFYDADDTSSTEPTITAANGQSKTAQLEDRALDKRLSHQSEDGAYNKRLSQQSRDAALHSPSRNSHMSGTNKKESGLVSYDRAVDTSSLHSDINNPNTKPNTIGLHLDPQDTSLSDDLSYLTLGGDTREAVDPSRNRHGEDIADRNALANEKRRASEHTAGRKVSGNTTVRKGSENTTGRKGSVFHVPAQVDEFSEDVADRNIDSPPQSSTSNTELYPMESQQEMNRGIVTSPFSSDEFHDPRFEQDSASSSRQDSEAPSPWKTKTHEAPLGHHVDADSSFLGQVGSSGSSPEARGVATTTGTHESFQQSSQPPQGKPLTVAPKNDFKDFDFNDSEDVDYHTRYAPAVTHETVIPVVRYVEEEVVTREIHNYDVYHRILPIKDVEILPTRHYLRDPITGVLTEIPAPPSAREGGHQQWKLVATDSDSGWQPAAPRIFTARTFGQDEGMFKEYVGEDGVPRTETTWIHPPSIQDGGYKTGQTEALFMDEFNDSKSKGKTSSVPGGWSDGVHEFDSKFSNGYGDSPELEREGRRRP
ncbi:hypothetical protein EG327_010557 [Venturia inaequalis]|uniref:Uncharacterized protein n=1 Tax=Venturia inaequalis TaxID=5025 RepID=A0A8H3YTN6_VENIN|nr:hypothetical protein EG327_010557 [Venturia inaequalis]